MHTTTRECVHKYTLHTTHPPLRPQHLHDKLTKTLNSYEKISGKKYEDFVVFLPVLSLNQMIKLNYMQTKHKNDKSLKTMYGQIKKNSLT